MNMNPDNNHTSGEKRHWVRLTRRCNNRCVFCLDGESLDGALLPSAEIAADLRAGRERGAERAVLSGGEPTVHPDFIGVVATARRLGYKWVQAVSNGRMFSYKKFLRDAVAAGLDEITFSLHAHERGLFEAITCAPGSFSQALAGLANALKSERLVVSVDIVMNRMNAGVLPEIVDFYYRMGVREFDLLFPVPFGRAWLNREGVMIEAAEIAPVLAGILRTARARGITFWTNRVPPPALEGLEPFIQSVEKLHDEVYGRREMFLDFMERNLPLPCHGERCRRCAMSSFCRMLARLRDGISSRRKMRYAVTSENAACLDTVRRDEVDGLCLDNPDLLEHPSVRPFTARHGTALTLSCIRFPLPAHYPRGCEMEISVNRHTAPFLLEKGLPSLKNATVFLVYRGRNSPRECHDEDISLKQFFERFREKHNVPENSVRNIPPCISGARSCARPQRVPPDIFNRENGWNLEALTRHYISDECYYHSMRCAGCARQADCPGIHVNYAAAFGFREIPGPVE
ncbi:MAG: radical SAM protein [bacterium]